MFSVNFFITNRKKIIATANVDVIIIAANGLLQKSADTTFAFRQDSNFWYLTGLDVAEAVLVIDVKNGNEFIILPPRLLHRDQWEGAVDTDELTKISGIATIYNNTQGWTALKQLVQSTKAIGTIIPSKAYEPNYGMYINPAKLVFARKIKRLAGDKLQDIRLQLARLRQVKSSEELQAIEQAVNITASSLSVAHKSLNKVNNEHDLQTILSYEFAKGGANSHAYDPIIACGKNAATIHYEKNDAPLVPGSLLLLDVGAQYGKYAADISRTWGLGTVTDRQKQVYDAVAAVHAYAMSLLKPGVVLRAYEQKVRDCMKEALVDLGLAGKNDTKAHLQYYPHLTSHFLGLDVHDAGDYDAPLVPNTVITVEPGIYIPNEHIGVRIEDDIVITEDGCKNLSANVPSDLLY